MRDGIPIRVLTVYGDSISTKIHGNGGYERKLQTALGIGRVDNHAVSGSGLSVVRPNSGLDIMQANPPAPDTDCILIWYGTNDWFWGSKAGRIEDSDDSSFLGAMGMAVDFLRRSAPLARLVWLTPLYRKEPPHGFDEAVEAHAAPNLSGTTLLDIHNTVVAGCRFHGVPVIDMHALCNIHRYNAEIYLEDQVHPNEEGYKVIANVLCGQLRQLFGAV